MLFDRLCGSLGFILCRLAWIFLFICFYGSLCFVCVVLCGSFGFASTCVVRFVSLCCSLSCVAHSVVHSLGFVTRCVVRVVILRCLFGCVDG